MAGVFPDETVIYIVPSGTAGSTLATSDKVIGEITNWTLSGGEKDTETIPVIGGFVDKESPRSQFEVSFDVIIQNTHASTVDRWDSYKFGSATSYYSSAVDPSDKAIFIHSTNGTTHKSFAFNNCKGVTWEPEMAADDMLRGSMTFKFSPATPLGVANLRTSSVHPSVINWA